MVDVNRNGYDLQPTQVAAIEEILRDKKVMELDENNSLSGAPAWAVASVEGGELVQSPNTSASIISTLSTTNATGGTVLLADAQDYSVKNSQYLTIDVAKSRFRGNSSKLTASDASNAAGFVMTVTGSASVPYGQERQTISDFEIAGPGRGNAAQVSGMRMQGSGVSFGAGPNRHTTSRYYIHDVATGRQSGANNYCTLDHSFLYSQCGTALYFQNGQTDAGEREVFSDGTISNSDVGVRIDGNQGRAVYFDRVSFDYLGVALNCRVGGGVSGVIQGKALASINQGWIESGDWATSPITFTVGSGDTVGSFGEAFVHLTNTTIVCTTPVGSRVMKSYADGVAGAEPIVSIGGLKLQNASPKSGRLGTGSARMFVWSPIESLREHGSPYLLSDRPDQNALVDGRFKGAIGDDITFISADVAAVTNPYSGTNGTIAYSTAVLDTGETGSWCMTKTGGAAAPFRAIVGAIPIRKTFCRGGFRLRFYRASGTGTVKIRLYYGVLRPTATDGLFRIKGTPLVVENPTGTWNGVSVSGTPLSHDILPATNGAWQDVYCFDSYRLYPRESDTHCWVEIDADAASASVIYVAKLEMAEV